MIIANWNKSMTNWKDSNNWEMPISNKRLKKFNQQLSTIFNKKRGKF